MARNYCLEDAPFAQPRVNNRGAGDGRTGMELPVLPWLAGRVGCVTGDFVTPWRVLSFAFSLLLCACLWLLARQRFGADAGPLAAICFATAPIVPYFSRSTQPDAAAAGLAALAMVLASRRAPLAFACMTLAALIKLPAAVYLLPVLVFAIEAAPARKVVLAALAALSAGVALAWYRYAASVEDATGIRNFNVRRTPAQLWDEWQLGETWLKSFVQRPFDVWIFPAVTVLLLAVLAWKRQATPRAVAVLGATALAYIFLCGHSGAHHEYYGLLLLPALCVMAAWALGELGGVAPRFLAPALGLFAIAAVAWQVARDRSMWASHEADWAALSAFSQGAPKGPIVVFGDGNPRIFWFSGRVGRFGDVRSPQVEPGELGMVDRLHLEAQAPAIEAALSAAGCGERFGNSVVWVCERR